MPLNAVYVRMNELLEELGRVTAGVGREIACFKDRAEVLGISWLGTAYEVYSRRLLSDIEAMEQILAEVVVMCSLLCTSILRYQETEMKVSDIIGGLGK